MTVGDKQKAECCGCNACAELCPHKCITMHSDAKGFLYPKIDATKCTECGACMTVCPLNHEHTSDLLCRAEEAYLAWNKNHEEHHRSSSGGAAYVICSKAINNGGVAYGCALNGSKAIHIRVDRIEDLKRLQGSKYVQSDIRGIYSQVKNDLKASREVVFVGTPCQVAGLKKYLKKLPENLLLIDIICHGVPSQQMLDEHLTPIAKSQINSLSFRKGNTFELEVICENRHYKKEFFRDLYYRAFFFGTSYRDCCYNCPFAGANRAGDISIGDFWGLRNPEQLPKDINDGASLIMPITEKGRKYLSKIKGEFNIFQRDIEEAISGNDQLRHPMSRSIKSKIFNLLYPTIDFDKAVYTTLIGEKAMSLLRLCIRKVKNGIRK